MQKTIRTAAFFSREYHESAPPLLQHCLHPWRCLPDGFRQTLSVGIPNVPCGKKEPVGEI